MSSSRRAFSGGALRRRPLSGRPLSGRALSPGVWSDSSVDALRADAGEFRERDVPVIRGAGDVPVAHDVPVARDELATRPSSGMAAYSVACGKIDGASTSRATAVRPAAKRNTNNATNSRENHRHVEPDVRPAPALASVYRPPPPRTTTVRANPLTMQVVRCG